MKNIKIKGVDRDGNNVDFEVELLEGTITEDGCCRFVFEKEKKAGVRKECALDGCQNKARRKFCSNKCKDRYHNLHNPRGKYSYLNPKSPEYDHSGMMGDDVHPMSDEAFDSF